MKAHVQNAWTRNPSLMINLSVEETQQLEGALDYLKRLCIADRGAMTANQQDAFNQLLVTLRDKLETDRPNGIKGAAP